MRLNVRCNRMMIKVLYVYGVCLFKRCRYQQNVEMTGMKHRSKLFSFGNPVIVALVLSLCMQQAMSTTVAQASRLQNHESPNSRELPTSVTMPVPWTSVSSATGKIVLGDNAFLGEFPWQVYLRFYQSSDHYYKGIYSYCGGSLISRTHVLTAAHCVIDPTKKRFYPFIQASFGLINRRIAHAGVNSFPLQQRWASNVVAHPNYSAKNLLNDVAVIRLVGPVSLNAYVKTVTLSKPNDVSLTVVGRPAVVSGWGKLGENLSASLLLKKANMTIRTCNVWGNPVGNICASGTSNGTVRPGICRGDSGGPLMSGSKQVGVNSFVYICGHSTVPDGFASVRYYYNWIKSQAPSIP